MQDDKLLGYFLRKVHNNIQKETKFTIQSEIPLLGISPFLDDCRRRKSYNSSIILTIYNCRYTERDKVRIPFLWILMRSLIKELSWARFVQIIVYWQFRIGFNWFFLLNMSSRSVCKTVNFNFVKKEDFKFRNITYIFLLKYFLFIVLIKTVLM